MFKFQTLVLLLIVNTSFIVNASDIKCGSVALSKSKTFIVTATIEGSKGLQSFPALIDTGATHTFIPKNVATSIGFNSQETVDFLTAAGKKSFTIITIKKLSFLGAEFNNVKVAIIDRKNTAVNTSGSVDSDSVLKEIAIIGMSELSKTKFVYESNKLTICSK